MIKLKTLDDQDVYVQPHHVVALFPKSKVSCTITLSDGSRLEVKGMPTKVVKLIEEGE